MIYSGDSVSSPKVVEYGGNTHGFGSRSVLGKGWPKELVKVWSLPPSLCPKPHPLTLLYYYRSMATQ